MSLAGAVVRRLSIFLATLIGASILIFLAVQALPGDVAQASLGMGASPEQVARLREQWGLDRPPVVRYLEWMTGLLRGDFGSSYLTGQSVASQIAPRLAVTAWLVGFAMPIAVLVAIGLGMVAAIRRRSWQGTVAAGLSQLGMAVPAFYAGILLVVVFAVRLRWLPANGYVSLIDPRGGVRAGPWLSHLVLPVVSLVIVQASVLSRYVRSSLIEVLSEDYYRTARSIGWTRYAALLRHGIRNAAISVVTVVGLQLATMIIGAIVVEQVFALPGLGTLLLSAVANRDLLIVQGVVMLLVTAVLVINLLVDLSYVAIDPRLRAQEQP